MIKRRTQGIDGTLLAPRLVARGEETASRSRPLGGKSHAVGEGQELAPLLSLRARSKRLPLTCRWFLSAPAARATSSPPRRGGGEEALAVTSGFNLEIIHG